MKPSASTVLVAAAFAVCFCCRPSRVGAEVLCADDVVPDGMAITATGTAESCDGACRARKTEAVCGPVVKICAGQPIPRGYVLDSITTVPACKCLGEEDNAYVVRYVGMPDDPDISNSGANKAGTSPYVSIQEEPDSADSPDSKVKRPYGNPPFGNLLCSEVPPEAQPDVNSSYPSPGQFGRTNSYPPYPPQLPAGGPWPAPTPSWGYQQNEPFRTGQ